MRRADEPFQFVVAFHLVRIRPERAENLAQLALHLHNVSEASIFYHTFQSMELHHPAEFTSDFAQWAMAACNQSTLAEQLSGIDLSAVISLAELRQSLLSRIEEHNHAFPLVAQRTAFEPFFFLESEETALPAGEQAYTLSELIEGIRKMSRQTLHYHMINARLRLHWQTNDFAHWVDTSLGLHQAAEELNEIDLVLNTIEDMRQAALNVLQPWVDG